MKSKIFLLLIAMVFTGSYLNAQTSFGVKGGVNWQTINGKDNNGDKLNNDLVTKFHIGLNAEIPVATDFYFQPGLMFITKGAKNTEGQAKSTLNLAYLEVPLNLLYKPVLGTGRLILGFGPYVGYGIGGKAKLEGTGTSDFNEDVVYQNDVKLSDPGDKFYVRRFDAGADIFAGYEFHNKFSVQLDTQLGLVNIFPKYEGTSNDKAKEKNTGFGISLGYRFK